MVRHDPPKHFQRFFAWFCHSDLHEELQGDLEESFYSNIGNEGLSQARYQYRKEVLKLFRPSVIKEIKFNRRPYLSVDMLRSYFKIAMRNLLTDRVNSLINIIGLTIGFASTFFILLYVYQETQVDKSFVNSERIYRITNDERPFNDKGRYLATVGPPFGPSLEAEYSSVEHAVRLRNTGDVVFKNGQRQFYEGKGFYVDDAFFTLFDFVLKSGEHHTALKEPNTIVLSEELARKYFGDANAIDETLMMNDEVQLKVTGVLAQEQVSSHLDFDFLISFETFTVPHGYPVTLESWGWISFPTYILLKDGINPLEFEPQLSEFCQRRVYVDRPVRSSFGLQPLSEIYFKSSDLMNGEEFRKGSLTYTYGLLIIALLILLVAGFNFMNIRTAQSIKRAREVGVRKVLGALQPQLMTQFIGEAILISMLSLIIAVLAFEAFGFVLLKYLDVDLSYGVTEYLTVLPVLAALAIAIGLLSSVYPAAVLSRFQPIRVLKGAVKSTRTDLNVKKGLVVFQFSITVGLIICSLVVAHQMEFVRNKNLGYAKEQLVSLQLNSDNFLQIYKVAQNVLRQNSNVIDITAGDVLDNDYGSVPMTPAGSETGIAMNLMGGYFNYFTTLGIEMAEGRDFSARHPADTSTGVIINEAALRTFGWDEPLGQKLQVNSNINGEIIGVVRDFHFRSLHDPIEPLVIVVPRTYMSNIILRIKPGASVSDLVASLKQDWNSIAPEQPFQFSFLDDALNREYEADMKFSRLIHFFSWLAICIAGMGLYGLIAIVSKFKVKEIGIRKVLGASVTSISYLLSKDFLLLILVANVIALPVAMWAMNGWLQNFTYRTTIPISLLVTACLISLSIAIGAIGYQVLKSALANPVDALKGD